MSETDEQRAAIVAALAAVREACEAEAAIAAAEAETLRRLDGNLAAMQAALRVGQAGETT